MTGRNKRYKELENTLVEQIIKMQDQGISLTEMSNILSVPLIKINRLRSKYNIKYPKKVAPIPSKEEILDAISSTQTYVKASKKFHVTYLTFKTWCDSYGIDTQKSYSKKYANRYISGIPDKDQFIQMYNTMMLSDIQQKLGISKSMINTLRKKYGIPARKRIAQPHIVTNSGQFPQQFVHFFFDKEAALTRFPPSEHTHITIANEVGICVQSIRNRLSKLGIEEYYKPEGNRSSYELEICSILDKWNIEYSTNNRSIVPGMECDIFIPSKNVGIEFNGTYWHSYEVKEDKLYHQNKFLKFKEAGVSLYQIDECRWNSNKDVIINDILSKILGKEKTLYARKLELKRVSPKESKEFLDRVHVQGWAAAKLTYGLYDGETLVSLMSFGIPRFDKSAEMELIRYATIANVIGGAQRLFSAFLTETNCGSVVSYALNGRGYSNFYNNLGFSFDGYTKPGYMWATRRDFLTRYQCQMKNEVSIMRERGYYRVFDAGNSKFVYSK